MEELQYRELKALVASTIGNASVVGLLKMDLPAWTAASHPLMWPPQSCCDPMGSKISMERMKAMALQMICHAHSSMHVNRADPGSFVMQALSNLHASGARSDEQKYSMQIVQH